jgi:hypothetical protein
VKLRITTTRTEEHEAAKDVLRRAGFEIHETKPVALTYALTFEAELVDLDGLKQQLRAVAPTALVNPVSGGT